MKWIVVALSAFVLALGVTTSPSVPLLHAQQPGA
jgi:hypothetical protein